MSDSQRGNAPGRSYEQINDDIMGVLLSAGKPGEYITVESLMYARDAAKLMRVTELRDVGASEQAVELTKDAYDYVGDQIADMFAGPYAGAVFPRPGEALKPGKAQAAREVIGAVEASRDSMLQYIASQPTEEFLKWARLAKIFQIANWAAVALILVSLGTSLLALFIVGVVLLFATKWMGSRANGKALDAM